MLADGGVCKDLTWQLKLVRCFCSYSVWTIIIQNRGLPGKDKTGDPPPDTRSSANARRWALWRPRQWGAEQPAFLCARFERIGTDGKLHVLQPLPVMLRVHRPVLESQNSSPQPLSPAQDTCSGQRQRGSLRFTSPKSGELKGKLIEAYLSGGNGESPYFKMGCLHLAKLFGGRKKWMPKDGGMASWNLFACFTEG